MAASHSLTRSQCTSTAPGSRAITSAASIAAGEGTFKLDDVQGASVSFAKASGSKCARCWKILSEVGKSQAHPHICLRCEAAVVEHDGLHEDCGPDFMWCARVHGCEAMRSDRAEAIRLVMHYSLFSEARATQRVRFIDVNRSYVINYGLGRDVVQAWVERQGPDHWQGMETLLASQILPVDLME